MTSVQKGVNIHNTCRRSQFPLEDFGNNRTENGKLTFKNSAREGWGFCLSPQEKDTRKGCYVIERCYVMSLRLQTSETPGDDNQQKELKKVEQKNSRHTKKNNTLMYKLPSNTYIVMKHLKEPKDTNFLLRRLS